MIAKEGSPLGLEGSGVCLAVGEGVDPSLVGKKVGFFVHGWASHSMVPIHHVYELNEDQDLREAAASSINTFAACAQIHLTKEAGSKSAICTAGASALAKMTYKLGQKEGIEVIGVVRREE